MARRQYFNVDILEQWKDRVINEAVDALRDAAPDGEASVRETIHAAVTPWGAARQAGEVHGPKGTATPREHAGRIEGGLDSQDMIGSVDSTFEEVGANVWEARWGWSDPAKYFLIQEHGFKEYDTNIVPMESLQRSLDEQEAEFAARLRSITRGAS
ncbi:hypothetical protein MRBLMI12_000514 [Microbacterium sp. LMI12-1-1.1]|uniref:hypothetical protein n=1 Tax=Microbacterium sp. LMI12-1-1.1 TaxID=3135225 RepID=UPI003446B469